MKKILLIFISLIFGTGISAQIPPGYYDAAAGLSGLPLRIALHNIIKNHNSITYDGLWTAYQTTDVKPNGKVWDIYSDVPGGTPPYQYTFVTDQCGSYQNEGDCYNREHSFPQSWFGDGTYPMYSDLFHVYPTDGKVNGERSNYPYGDVGTVSWTSQNGSKLGSCNDSGYSSTVFEPIDEYKGDIARSYFYMAVRYYTEDASWPGSAMVSGAEPLLWARNVLLSWSSSDTVSQKEINRNNSIYVIQHNRNPFIDHPEWILAIWGPTAGIYENDNTGFFRLYPVPASSQVNITDNLEGKGISKVEVYSTASVLIHSYQNCGKSLSIDLTDYPAGVYFVRITDGNSVVQKKLMVVK
jgi:endonuclease I